MLASAPAGANIRVSHYYEEYSEYAKTLRTWFVAYGIGGPVVYLTQKDIPGKIACSGHGQSIALLFLFGVAIQLLVALLYKAAAWRLYSTQDLRAETLDQSDWAKRVEKYYEIDIVADFLTILLLAWATGWVFKILGSNISASC